MASQEIPKGTRFISYSKIRTTSDSSMNLNVDVELIELETLLRDAHALAVVLLELSEDGRATDGRNIVGLIKPKLSAAKRPLAKWESAPSNAARAEVLGLRKLYDETRGIVDAEDEADTYVHRPSLLYMRD
jgi:hypothetical protein